MCCSLQSWAARNPKIGIPCCLASCSVLWLLLYSIFIIVEYTRVEVYQETKCTVQSYDMRQRDCSLNVCQGSSTTSCQTVNTVCWSCRYWVSAPTREGIPLVGYTDLTDNWQRQEDATKGCLATLTSSPVPCYYQPSASANPNIRFLISLSRPGVVTSMLPVIAFGIAVILLACVACACACKTAAESREVAVERMYSLARQRAMDGQMRQARWSDIAEQEAWENDVGWLPPSASPTGPAPRVVVPAAARRRVAEAAMQSAAAGQEQDRAARARAAAARAENDRLATMVIVNPMHSGYTGGHGGGM